MHGRSPRHRAAWRSGWRRFLGPHPRWRPRCCRHRARRRCLGQLLCRWRSRAPHPALRRCHHRPRASCRPGFRPAGWPTSAFLQTAAARSRPRPRCSPRAAARPVRGSLVVAAAQRAAWFPARHYCKAPAAAEALVVRRALRRPLAVRPPAARSLAAAGSQLSETPMHRRSCIARPAPLHQQVGMAQQGGNSAARPHAPPMSACVDKQPHANANPSKHRAASAPPFHHSGRPHGDNGRGRGGRKLQPTFRRPRGGADPRD
jgi:hypothetical protein